MVRNFNSRRLSNLEATKKLNSCCVFVQKVLDFSVKIGAKSLFRLPEKKNICTTIETKPNIKIKYVLSRSSQQLWCTLTFLPIFSVRLHPGTTVWHSGENYDSGLKRYGIEEKFVSQEPQVRIAEGLRAGLPLDVVGIRTALATHLKERIDAMENQLVFVEECWPPDLQGKRL